MVASMHLQKVRIARSGSDMVRYQQMEKRQMETLDGGKRIKVTVFTLSMTTTTELVRR